MTKVDRSFLLVKRHFNLPLNIEEPVFPIERKLLDFFVTTVALLNHTLTVLLELLESDLSLLVLVHNTAL